MPQVIACPSCPTKLKVPDNAGGRRVKCPKCGGVMTIPSDPQPAPPPTAALVPPPVVVPPPSPELPPPDEFDFPAPTPPAAKRRVDEPPVRATRPPVEADDRPARKPVPPAPAFDDDEDALRPPDADPTTDRLHKGWKAVALGYRFLGLAMLSLLLGTFAFAGTFVAFEGLKVLETSDRWTNLTEQQLTQLAIPLGIGGLFSFLVGLFTLLGFGFLMGMPSSEKGGRGKGLAIAMFFLLFAGLGVISALLLPFFSAGVGTALDKPRLRKDGIGLLVWYLVGIIGVPLLAVGSFFGITVGLGDGVLASIVATAVGSVLGFFVFFSVWGTLIGMRRGISASIRERGIIGGEGPKPVETKRGRKGRDRDEEDDRPRKRTVRDETPPRPVKVKRPKEEDSDDELPAANRRRDDDSDSDHDRPRR